MDPAILKSLSIFTRISTTNAASGVHFDELTETIDNFVDLLGKFSSRCQYNSLAFGRLGVDKLKEPNGKGSGFACSWLCLSDGVPLADNWGDSLLLNDGWFFEAEG